MVASENMSSMLEGIIRPLCGTKQAYEFEKQQSLFRLKFWLLSIGKSDRDILVLANRTFYSILFTEILSQAINSNKKTYGDRAPSDCLHEILDSDGELRTAVDRGFVIGKGFQSPDILSAIKVASNNKVNLRRIKSVNAFTHFCIRTSFTEQKATISSASKLYAYAASLSEGKLIKDIEQLRTTRRQRLSFLYVAYNYHLELPNFPPTLTGMWKHLCKQARERELLKDYFSKCAWVQGVVGRGSEASGEILAKWAGRRPTALHLDHVTPEEAKAAEDYHISTSI